MTVESKRVENEKGEHTLRFAKKSLTIRSVDRGYSCLVGDKAIRVYPNNLVEVSDLELLRDETTEAHVNDGYEIAYKERLSWITQYPLELSLDEVKASIDYAFFSAGLPSLFFLTNIFPAQFTSPEELTLACLKAFTVLYPGVEPSLTELNGTLQMFGWDSFYRAKADS